MDISPDGIALIQAFEGLGDGDPHTVLLEPYIAPEGNYTVGYGYLLTQPDGQPISVKKLGAAQAKQLAGEAMQRLFGAQALTKDQAVQLLHTKVRDYVAEVNKVVDDATTQAEFDAMVSFCYNVGQGNFDGSVVRKFHVANNRLVGDVSMKALCLNSQAHAPETNMAIAWTRWSNMNGRWTLGVFRRRLAELFVYGGHDLHTSLRYGMGFVT